jgi:hypothetical protein
VKLRRIPGRPHRIEAVGEYPRGWELPDRLPRLLVQTAASAPASHGEPRVEDASDTSRDHI